VLEKTPQRNSPRSCCNIVSTLDNNGLVILCADDERVKEMQTLQQVESPMFGFETDAAASMQILK